MSDSVDLPQSLTELPSNDLGVEVQEINPTVTARRGNPRPRKEEKITPIVQARVGPKKGSAIAHQVQRIGGQLFEDVVLPAIKNAISDFVVNGIEMVIWGREERGGSRRRRNGRRTNYATLYRDPTVVRSPERRGSHRRNPKQPIEINDIYFTTANDAQITLSRLYERIATYGWATVGDLYSMTGVTGDFSHERFGWDNLDGSRVRMNADGYYLDLPEPRYN